MRVSCIALRAGTSSVLLREDYLEICDRKPCAAMILSQMQYWHEIKCEHATQARIANEIAIRGGLRAEQDIEIWIYKTHADMKQELMGLFGDRAIAEGYAMLLDLGFLKDRNNPIYTYDRTKQYRFDVEVVQIAIAALPSAQNCVDASRKFATSKLQNCDIEAANLPDRSGKFAATIPETTSKTTNTKITTEEKAQAPTRAQTAKTRPLEKELADFFRANGSCGAEARKMWDYYQSNGWKVGRNPMRDWQASARNWIRRAQEELSKSNPLAIPAGTSLRDGADINARVVDRMRAEGRISGR